MTADPWRELPADQEAEEACIASALVSPEALDAMPRLRPQHFRDEHLAQIWAAILDVARRGDSVNTITVAHELGRADGRLDAIGGMSRLSEIVRGLATPYGCETWAAIVEQLAQRRRLITEGTKFVDALYDGTKSSPSELSGQMVERLIRLGADRSRPITRTVGEILRDPLPGDPDGELSREIDAFLDNTASARGWSLGWPLLDDLLGGLEPGRVYTILAATGVGKSYFSLNVSSALAQQDVGVLYVSTEMPGKELARRLVFLEAGCDRNVIRAQASATDTQREAVYIALSRLSGVPIAITDVGGIDLEALRMEAKRQRHQRDVSVLIIDHMGDVRVKGSRSKVDEMTEVARATKEIAMNEYLAVIQVAHVNRESAKSGWVDLHSARDSGSIENYSDVVLCLNPVYPGGDNFASRQDVDAFIARYNYVPIHASIAKGRNGGKGWDVRALDWDSGGRFVPVGEAEDRRRTA